MRSSGPIGRDAAVRERTRTYSRQWHAAFGSALKRAEALGELTPGPIEDRAWLLLAGHTAVMVAAAAADTPTTPTTPPSVMLTR